MGLYRVGETVQVQGRRGHKYVNIKAKKVRIAEVPKKTLGPSARAFLSEMLRERIRTGDIITLGPGARAYLLSKGIRELPPMFRLVEKKDIRR
jgi:hypothetical protein